MKILHKHILNNWLNVVLHLAVFALIQVFVMMILIGFIEWDLIGG